MTRRTPSRTAPRRATPRKNTTRRVAAHNVPRRRESRGLAFFRQWASTIFVLALLAVTAHLTFGEHGFLAMRRMKQSEQKLQQEISAMNEENRRLSSHVDALKTDPRMIERIAREEMGLARPGELIFKLPPKPETKK